MSLTKRITAALLCALMLASSLISCSSPSDNSTADETTTAAGAVSETTTAETTAAPEYTVPDIDLSGQTFVFSSYQQDNPTWTARKYIEASRPELNGDIINDAIYERIAAAEEDLGVKIESRTFSAAATMTNATMAGDHYADCVLMSRELKPLLDQNMLTDLYSIETLDLSKSWWNQRSIEALSIGGKLFFAAGSISPFGILASYSTYVNKALVRDHNLDNPYDEVRNGTWTWDKMAEMSRAVAKDVDGDGAMTAADVFGMSSESSGFQTVGSCGVRYTKKNSDDIPELVLDPELAAAAIEKIVPMFRDKSISLYAQDFASGYKNVFRELITQKFIEDELMFINNWLVVSLDLRNMESDFGILPPPKLTEAQEEYMSYHAEIWSTYAFVPITATEFDMIGHVMNSLGYYGHEHIHKALIETTITSKTLRDTDTEEMLDIIYRSRVFEIAGLYDWGGIGAFMTSFINNSTTNFASTYAANETKILTAMEATIENLK